MAGAGMSYTEFIKTGIPQINLKSIKYLKAGSHGENCNLF